MTRPVQLLLRLVARIPPEPLRKVRPHVVRGWLQLLVSRATRLIPRDFRSRAIDGFWVTGNTRDTQQRRIFVFGLWEPDMTAFVRQHLRPGDYAVDVGANIGYFSLLAASRVGATGKVIAIEPVPRALSILHRNVQENGLQAVIHVKPLAVGHQSGSVDIFEGPAENLGGSTRIPTGLGFGGCTTVPLAPTCDVLSSEEWQRVRLVKIDVEGDELDVLRGLAPVLPQLAPGAAVVLELNPAWLRFREQNVSEVFDLLDGFSCFRVANVYQAKWYANREAEPPFPVSASEIVNEQCDLIFIKDG